MRVRRAVVLVCTAALLLALTGAPQPAGAADTKAAFRNGRATATAQVLKIGPGVGGLELATAVGTTAAQVANNLAQAQAQAIDLGLVGTTLTAEGCDGSPGAVTPDQLPKAVTVDNRKGNATATADEIPVSGDLLGGGRKTATASTTPSSEATVTGIASSLAGVTISGGRSDAITRVVDKDAREADASTSVDIDIAGIVHLSQARWNAVHRTGAGPKTEGTFSLTNGTAGDVPLPIDQLGTAQDAINKALEFTGMSVDLPHVEHITSPNDLIRVTPLVIALRYSQLGKTVFGPVLNGTREQREQVFTAIASRYCQAAGALLVGDIGLDIASGTGFITIEIGGVEATTSDPGDFNPFGSNDPLGVLDSVITNLTGPGPTTLPSLAPTGVIAPPGEAALVAVRNICESVSRSKRVGCSKGDAWPIGIIGVVLTAAIAGLDWRRRRVLAAAS